MPKISNARRTLEISAVIITGIGKFIFVDLLPYKVWYIITAIIFWVVYILWQSINNREILSYWGFHKKDFKKLFLKILPVVSTTVLIFLAFGLVRDTLVINWHLLPILLLYPLWGVIQQFLMIGLVAVNLEDFKSIDIPRIIITTVTAILFSMVHYPSIPLLISTFVLGVCYAFLFLRYRNIWVLGIYHGWLGAFFYFFVLKKDPWIELMNTL